MLMQQIIKTWKRWILKANSYGVPVPLVHDPKAGQASVSLTLVFISSILVIIGIVGKWSKVAGNIDMSNAMEFLYASLGLYFGRQWQSKSGATLGDSIQEGAPQKPSDPAQ